MACEFGLAINIGLMVLGILCSPVLLTFKCWCGHQLCKVIVCCEIETVTEQERGNYSLFQFVDFSSFSTNCFLPPRRKLIK